MDVPMIMHLHWVKANSKCGCGYWISSHHDECPACQITTSERAFKRICKMAALVGSIWQKAVPSGLDRQTVREVVTKRQAPRKKRCSHEGHQRGDVGINRRIKGKSIKVETLHSYILRQRQSCHHDSQRFELMCWESLGKRTRTD